MHSAFKYWNFCAVHLLYIYCLPFLMVAQNYNFRFWTFVYFSFFSYNILFWQFWYTVIHKVFLSNSQLSTDITHLVFSIILCSVPLKLLSLQHFTFFYQGRHEFPVERMRMLRQLHGSVGRWKGGGFRKAKQFASFSKRQQTTGQGSAIWWFDSAMPFSCLTGFTSSV